MQVLVLRMFRIKNYEVQVKALKGMYDGKNSSLETAIIKEELGLQDVIEEVTTSESSVSIQEITEEINSQYSVATSSGKRKKDEAIEVSSSQKRARMTSPPESGECSEHSYFMKSPRRTRRQVDYLTDKIERLQKKVKILGINLLN